jgi:SAM-dependent methyltransferase
MEYSTDFSKRAASYLHALKTYPSVLQNEFETAVQMCDLQDKDTLLLIPCSCEHIQPWLPPSVRCIEFETNKVLATITKKPHCEFHTIPLQPASVSRILSLATLHHLTDEERLAFYKEARRVLQPGGKLILGDVVKNSQQDGWLNTFVDAYNSCGHRGRFFTEADRDLLEAAGFTVRIQYADYTWDFESYEQRIDFCRHLFHLDKASDNDIQEGLKRYFDAPTPAIQWKLVYFCCTSA